MPACPACSALVHRERLEQLASLAEAATATDPAAARAHWHEALSLVPVQSQQYQQISERLAALNQQSGDSNTSGKHFNWGGSAVGIGGAIALLVAGKLKFLLLGLSKLSTVASMFGFIAVYWAIHGWPLAIGIATAIYVHEMGHVAMLRRLGIEANAPYSFRGSARSSC